MHNSSYDLKFILPVLAGFQKSEAVDGKWVDGSFSCDIITKSFKKLLLLEFQWKKKYNGNKCLNKIRFLDSFSFFSKSLSQ